MWPQWYATVRCSVGLTQGEMGRLSPAKLKKPPCRSVKGLLALAAAVVLGAGAGGHRQRLLVEYKANYGEDGERP